MLESGPNATNLTHSIGATVAGDGRLTVVVWESPVYKAGLVTGDQIVAVNGTAFRGDRLKDDITEAKRTGKAIELLVRSGDKYRTIPLNYQGGLRYPHLERIAATPALLDEILSPRR
jgi:predicted metalloprotease with PDZ domain